MADIGDVVTFNPKGPTKGPVPGIEYVVCSRGPEYVMATVKEPERAVRWTLVFINNKPFYRAGKEPEPTDINYVARMTVKALPQVVSRNEMESIKKLINEEKVLKEQMKALRVDLWACYFSICCHNKLASKNKCGLNFQVKSCSLLLNHGSS
jgi:hypothetical protein